MKESKATVIVVCEGRRVAAAATDALLWRLSAMRRGLYRDEEQTTDTSELAYVSVGC